MLNLKIKAPLGTSTFDEDHFDRIMHFKLDFSQLMSLLFPGNYNEGELCFEYDPNTKKFKIDYIAKSLRPQVKMIQSHFVDFKREYIS
ncbi:hypothetical protein [Ascidiimonas sp. W6]|uniref:hypothetical protein n=1 Tax=Ascidiimonas meishanensis TaxID=3128903 RepID=UPI0030EC7B2E